jgi:uncharacterized protein YutE (UPF0331/DUF86 family)
LPKGHDGINLGEIEWYHRLRNELYHQGNGLTVERDKVEVYAELAKILFENLFGFKLTEPEDEKIHLLGSFIEAWTDFEKTIMRISKSDDGPHRMILDTTRIIQKDGFISPTELAEIDHLRMIRNEVVHGVLNHKESLKPSMVERLKELTNEIIKRVESNIEKTDK